VRGCAASFCAAAIRSASGGSALVSFSGLPGLTSHQTRSRPRRFNAIRLAARWAACGGLNEPPNSPIFMPGACGGRRDAAGVFAVACDFTGVTSPLAGEVGVAERRREEGRLLCETRHPPPHPSPTRGEGGEWGESSASDERPRAISRPDLARTPHAVFEAAELLGSDRPARVQPPGGDADLAPEAELAAACELGRGVVQHDPGAHPAQEFLRRPRTGRDDRVGVALPVVPDMRDRLPEAAAA